MKKTLSIMLSILLILCFLAACAPAAKPTATTVATTQEPVKEKLVYGYIAPTADTWYQMNIDGFKMGANADNIEVKVMYTDYDVEKELAAIDTLVNEGVDGICIFSFNETGPIACAKKAATKNIPVVVTDSVGSSLGKGVDVVAAVDFNWTEMGKTYAQWMADNRPGEKFYIMTGTLESVPCKRVNESMIAQAKELGKNENVGLKPYNYNPNDAVTLAQDLLSSGLDFSVLFVMDETAGGAVIRMLQEKGQLNKPVTVISQNGSPRGLSLVKSGDLSFTISSSPGWEGLISYYALDNYVSGKNKEINQQIMLPIMPVTKENIEDSMQVVPWDITPDLYLQLTKKYFPQYAE